MRPSAFVLAIIFTAAASCNSSRSSQSSASKEKPGKYTFIDAQTFQLSSISDDETYGYTESNPIKVGDKHPYETGAANEKAFMNALLGPNGETVSYHRRGSCCPFKTRYGMMGGGRLDIYIVTYKGEAKEVTLYLNMYDPGIPKAPKGFTFKKNEL